MSTINNPRLLLWGALALILYVDYDAWMRDYGPKLTAPTAATSGQQPAGGTAAPGAKGTDLGGRVPDAPATATAAGAAPAHEGSTPGAAPAAVAGTADATAAPAEAATLVHVRTDVLDVAISTQGGTIERADLLAYPRVKGGAEPVRLENAR